MRYSLLQTTRAQDVIGIEEDDKFSLSVLKTDIST
jgi:hypothetical protein